MFHRLCATTVAIAVLLAASACSDPRETQRAEQLASQRLALSSQLQEADSGRALAGQAVAALRQRLQASGDELASARSRAAAHRSAVQAFMMDHKMAVAALAAGAAGGLAALDESGSVSQEAREIGAVVGIIAVGWALLNMEEVMLVASELVKAESTQQALDGTVDTLSQRLAAEQGEMQQAQAELDRVNEQVTSVRTALQAL